MTAPSGPGGRDTSASWATAPTAPTWWPRASSGSPTSRPSPAALKPATPSPTELIPSGGWLPPVPRVVDRRRTPPDADATPSLEGGVAIGGSSLDRVGYVG